MIAVPRPPQCLEDDLKLFEKQIAKDISSPDAELLVLRLYETIDTHGPKAVIDSLERILEPSRSGKLSSQARAAARFSLARAYARNGNTSRAHELFDEMGFIRQWRTAAPFENEGGSGFNTSFFEGSSFAGVTDTHVSDNQGKQIPWRPMPKEAHAFGYNHLDSLTARDSSCVALTADFQSNTSSKGTLLVGGAGAYKVYWNNALAVEEENYRGPFPDRLAASVRIEKGKNTIFVWACSDEGGELGLYARVSVDMKAPKAKRTLSNLKALANRKKPSPKILEDAARYYLLTHANHPGSHAPRGWAQSACEKTGTKEACLLWKDLALDRNERRDAVNKALKKHPEDPDLLAHLAQIELSGPDPRAALEGAQKVLRKSPGHVTASNVEAQAASVMGFPLTAHSKLETLCQKRRESLTLLRRCVDSAADAGLARVATEYNERVLDVAPGDLHALETASRMALASGDQSQVEHLSRRILTYHGHDRTVLGEVSAVLEGAKLYSQAREALESALSLCPEDPGIVKALGLFELRRGNEKKGEKLLSRALVLKPQDVWLADYLEHRNPVPPFEAPYLTSPDEFLPRRGAIPEGHEARILVDTTVVKIFETGLSSTFTQLVVEVGSHETAKAWRQYGVQFSPESQRVRLREARVFHPDGTVERSTGRGIVPISEPWYRLYYDVEAEVVELPPLRPGDVVEYSYRVDDTAARNDYADYFGDLAYVNGEHPKAFWRYVALLPSGRKLNVKPPLSPGAKNTTKERGGINEYSFQVTDVPVVIRESAMPGESAGLDYLHLSTYESWDDLADWYKGLVRNQLVADSRIKQKARELTGGLKSDRAKVEAIYKWVVTATRYVGLEFGIHGYKPYRAPLVVARGFGDCKDKASLLVTTLREVGIDAQLVLVRTRSAGDIDTAPPSLSVFNHAIAYVPSLDLWLDGTAEHHGTGDFPFEDQDSVALRLSTKENRIERTPVFTPEANVKKEEVTVLLDPDGDVSVKKDVSLNGSGFAPWLRRELEAKSSRRERFEIELVATHPGARLGDLTVSDLGELEEPVRYSYDAFIPHYAVKTDDELRVPVDDPMNLSSRYAKTATRTHPLSLGPPRILERTMTVPVPVGMESKKLPSTAILSNDHASLKVEFQQKGNEISVYRKLVIHKHLVSPKDYKEFASFCAEADRVLRGALVLKEKKR